jgi:hypothetical protein
MAFTLPDLSGLTTQLGSLMPSGSSIIQQIALGAASGVVLSGLKAQVASGQIPDPLNLTGAAHPAPANNPNQVVGPTVTASAFAQLPPAVQAQLTAAGVHIVAG